MNSILKQTLTLLRGTGFPHNPLSSVHQQLQQWRGIRVQVRNGNLEQALTVMQRRMRASGMEYLIKRQSRYHIKNSEKRILARKNLERKIRSEELSRKLYAIISKKVR
nr:TPA_asm: hypothetical protein HUJ06_026057 [Nelumbo nucifera]